MFMRLSRRFRDHANNIHRKQQKCKQIVDDEIFVHIVASCFLFGRIMARRALFFQKKLYKVEKKPDTWGIYPADALPGASNPVRKVHLRSPRAMDVRVDERARPDEVRRGYGCQNDRAEFIGRSLPDHGRDRTVAVRGNDCSGRNRNRSRFDGNRRCYHHRSRGNDDWRRNSHCRERNNDLCGTMQQRTSSLHRANSNNFDCGKRQRSDSACSSRQALSHSFLSFFRLFLFWLLNFPYVVV